MGYEANQFQSTLPAGEATRHFLSSIHPLVFQSTLPAGEATLSHGQDRQRQHNFNPRFPRGKRRAAGNAFDSACAISIHASRGGSDLALPAFSMSSGNFNPRFPRGKRPADKLRSQLIHGFQSTLPAGEATAQVSARSSAPRISIHASRGGSDLLKIDFLPADIDFNPRFPRGKRLCSSEESIIISYFNPRFPRGKRQDGKFEYAVVPSISIHASRGGSDIDIHCISAGRIDFNPRFPRGKRQCRHDVPAPSLTISIHASRGGSDSNHFDLFLLREYFNPRFPRGKRHKITLEGGASKYFNPRFPRGKRHFPG